MTIYTHGLELRELIINNLKAIGLYRNRVHGHKREFDVMSPLTDDQLCNVSLTDCQYSVTNTIDQDDIFCIALYGMKTDQNGNEHNQMLFYTYAFDTAGFIQANLVFMDLISESEKSLLGW